MFSNDTTSYEYNLGLASEEYTLGFGLYHANEQMRDRNGTNIDVVNKNPVLLTAASLNWHRKRNRYFLDSISLVLFRSQPVLPSSDCQFDPNTPYVKLSSNYTSMAFMSLSTSALFPLEWIFQQEAWMPGISSKPVSVLVVYRDQTSSSSAGYMWPVSVTSQTEAVYVPGKQFFNLACRRQVVTLPLDGRSLQVAYTLMYEADSGVRQSARNEARIEQALNAAIDATNTTCSPQLCASLVWRSIPAVQKLSQPTALACVDLTSKQGQRSFLLSLQRQQINEIAPRVCVWFSCFVWTFETASTDCERSVPSHRFGYVSFHHVWRWIANRLSRGGILAA
jgi:hypothetical protein